MAMEMAILHAAAGALLFICEFQVPSVGQGAVGEKAVAVLFRFSPLPKFPFKLKFH